MLVKIGFSAERIEQCLNALGSGWDLDDAMDWVSTSKGSASGFDQIGPLTTLSCLYAAVPPLL